MTEVVGVVDRITSQYRGTGKKSLEDFLTPEEINDTRKNLAEAVLWGMCAKRELSALTTQERRKSK